MPNPSHPPLSPFRSPNEEVELKELKAFVQTRQFSVELDALRAIARTGKVEDLSDKRYRFLRKVRSLMLEVAALEKGNRSAGQR